MSKKSSTKSRAARDPHAAREADKYENPIPSREFILQFLEERGQLYDRVQLAELLELHDEEQQEALRRRLRAMERDGQLIFTRRGYAPASKLDLVRGRVIGHPDGFGFLVPEEGGDDLYLSAHAMHGVLHGDRVMARVKGIDRRGRKEGAIVEVLERVNQQVVGRFYSDSGVDFVVSENKRINQDILIPAGHTNGAISGQFVVANIVEQPTSKRQAIGHVAEILGDHMAPGMEIDVAIRSHSLPNEWSAAVEDEIRLYSEQVPEEAKQGRVDLRATPLVTIDGEDARDFDDAVYCESRGAGKGWRLLVAIADVSHYVKPGAALDTEAHERGNSVYFPERVIPMLPEVLSNGLCSLNPKVDRLCMVCEMQIDVQGKVVQSRFMEAVMCSHARLTYTEVAAMLVDGDTALRNKYQALVPHLEQLHALYQVMRVAREKRGAIDFDTTETRIVFSEERKIERIVPVYRNDAHMLIEECMIAANVSAAHYLLKNKIPALYRIHDAPGAEKLADLREFLGELGLGLRGGDEPQAKDYAQLLVSIKGRADAHLIQTVLLRSLKQAQYSPDNIGHFGLAHDGYAHFTSPIRRYPDLLVHRAIRHLLAHGKAKNFAYSHDNMQVFGEHCSMTDRRADEATRDAVNWLKCEFMQDKVGEEFDGVITSVTSFGLFVELDEIYVEGLVHVTSLDNDYYHFDPASHRLRGERTAKIYRLGDHIKVRVVRVDLDERKIDFDLLTSGSTAAEQPAPGRGKKGASGKKSKQDVARGGENKAAGKKKRASKKKVADENRAPASKKVVSKKKSPAKKKAAARGGDASGKKGAAKKQSTGASADGADGADGANKGAAGNRKKRAVKKR